MNITGTHIAYLHTCHRKLWLFANGMRMEDQSALVQEGKLIDETTYSQRSDQFTQIELEGIKIDFYDSRNKVVHETKKSDKVERAHEAQLKYYIWKLHQHGIEDVRGVLEYPKLRHTTPIELTAEDFKDIPLWEDKVLSIINSPHCPPLIKKGICKRCAYYEFCYVKD